MPTLTLTLQSQRGKPITDRVTLVSAHGRFSGPLHPDDIELRPGEILFDVVPDQYTIEVAVGGFASVRTPIKVGATALARVLRLEHLCTTLPRFNQLGTEQQRLVGSLDAATGAPDIWNGLSDNKTATFFQVTHALSSIQLADGTPLSSTVDRVVRLGGSELTAPDTSGATRTVIGWRMHVVFVGGAGIDGLLEGAGFERDSGRAHPTHRRFGFVRSFRERRGSPKVQVVVNHEGRGADVDIDRGAFHQSSPHDVRKAFAKRFPETTAIYQVK